MSCDLLEFVNRETPLAAFSGMLGHASRRILLIQGREGMGKSCLVQRLRSECGQRQLRAALVDFRGNTALAQPDQVIRALREEMGGVFARQLEQAELQIQQNLAPATVAPLLIHWLGGQTAPGGGHHISLSGQVEVGGDIVGGDKITIANPTIVLNPNGGFDLGQAEAQTRRNTAFRTALAAALTEQPLVLFFDHFEEATTEVKNWLRQHILGLHLEGEGNGSGRFGKLWVVAAGRSVPLQDEITRWRRQLDLQPLERFPDKIIELYWVEKRGLRREDVPVIVRVSGGSPFVLALLADNDEIASGRSQAQ